MKTTVSSRKETAIATLLLRWHCRSRLPSVAQKKASQHLVVRAVVAPLFGAGRGLVDGQELHRWLVKVLSRPKA